MPTTTIDNIINHIVLVLDASTSMTHLSDELIKVADNQISYLAQRSKELDQETRITVYSFASSGLNYRTPKIGFLDTADAFLDSFTDVHRLADASFETGDLPQDRGPLAVVPAAP